MGFVLGKTFINDRTMRVAKRYSRRFGSNAVPDHLHETQSFLDGELEDFCNVGITHIVTLAPFGFARERRFFSYRLAGCNLVP